MPRRSHGPSIKDPDQYETLLEEGMSQQKAARISNASARDGRSQVGRRGGLAEDYPDRTKDELLQRARELGVAGRSRMSKSQLIDALREQ